MTATAALKPKRVKAPAKGKPKAPSEIIITLPHGLLGFEPIKQYRILERPSETPFLWLQRLDDSRQGFLLMSPGCCAIPYSPEISDEDAAFLQLKTPDDALVFNIVTLYGDGQATLNLKGPLVINRRTLIAKQIVPVNIAEYSARHPLPTNA